MNFSVDVKADSLSLLKKIIIYTIMMSSGANASAKEAKPSEDWFQCKIDSDCIHINYSCAGAAVNKSVAKIAKEYYRLQNARTDCYIKEPSKEEKKVPYKVFCEKLKCSVQGVDPKEPGFS